MIKDESVLLNQIVKQIKGNIVSDMGEEKVMLSINKGKYYNLGQIGGAIWDLIEDRTSVKDLVNTLMTKYEVEQNECEEQVITFLETLLAEELIEIIA